MTGFSLPERNPSVTKDFARHFFRVRRNFKQLISTQREMLTENIKDRHKKVAAV